MPQEQTKVLFVDDDLTFLDMIQKLMTHYAGEQWQIHTAPDVSAALGVLQEHAIALLVVDMQMPVVDGLQFLKLLQRKYPNLLKVALTGFATEEYRAACLSHNGTRPHIDRGESPRKDRCPTCRLIPSYCFCDLRPIVPTTRDPVEGSSWCRMAVAVCRIST